MREKELREKPQMIPVRILLWLALGPVGALAQCNPATSVADPRIGVVDWPGTAGTNCFFPFTYGGTVFNECDGSYCDGSFCGFWCATSCNYPADYSRWRFCKFMVADLAKPNCSGLANISASTQIEVYGGSGSGTQCYFPFMHNNVCYDDCIVTGGEPWCATTDVMYHVSTNQRFCRSTLKGLRDPSCSGLNATAPVYLPQQVGNYSTVLVQSDPTGNCTFPFYYKEKCYDDCTTVDAQAWDLPWCLTEKYYDPNKKTRVCPHYRRYKEVTGLALSWGFFYVRQHDSCATAGAACNQSWSLAGSAIPTTSGGSGRMALSSAEAEPVEVMPQPNGFFILKLPRNCSANWNSVSIDGSDVGVEPITIEREFWDIKATATPNVFTVQSMRNSTRGMYLSFSTVSGSLVLSLSSGSATQWRFDQLSDVSMATHGLPCDNPTKVNGTWCTWGAYIPSGGGMSTRNRSCACPPAIGGLPCEGNSTETEILVNGTWCEWSAYSGIGGGYGTRSRECNCSAPAYGGADCPGSGNDTGLMINGSWCEWSAYIVGSDSQGSRTRICNCSAPEYGGANCAGASNETGPAVNGSWCDWSPFVSIGGGFGSRTRVCNCSMPAYGGNDCPGSGNETGPAVNGSWCEWSAYTIGSDNNGSRTRTCNCSAPTFGGADCAGLSNETGPAVNGSWCAWSLFSVSGGQGTRERACNCSAPAYGGANCPGTSNETGTTVGGSWCPWSAFSVNGSHGVRARECNCSAPAYGGAYCVGLGEDSGATTNGTWCAWSGYVGNGTHEIRSRQCNCSAPAYGGAVCPDVDAQSSPIVDGIWCAWSAWATSATTVGLVIRTRSCNCPTPSILGADCAGLDTLRRACTTTSCIPYAQPLETGQQGSDLTSISDYRKLVAWASVICICMIACLIVGLALMAHRAIHANNSVSAVSSVIKPPPIFSDYDSYGVRPV